MFLLMKLIAETYGSPVWLIGFCCICEFVFGVSLTGSLEKSLDMLNFPHTQINRFIEKKK